MLVLSRQRLGSLIFSTAEGDWRLEILDIRGESVRIGITAPRDVKILREELYAPTQKPQQKGGKK